MKKIELKKILIASICLIGIGLTSCKKTTTTPNNTTNSVNDTLSKYSYYTSCTLDGITSSWGDDHPLDSLLIPTLNDYFYYGSMGKIYTQDSSDHNGNKFGLDLVLNSNFNNNALLIVFSESSQTDISKFNNHTLKIDTNFVNESEFTLCKICISNNDTTVYLYTIEDNNKLEINYSVIENKIFGTYSGEITLISECKNLDGLDKNNFVNYNADWIEYDKNKTKKLAVNGKFCSGYNKIN